MENKTELKKYQVMSPLSKEDRKILRDDIERRGVQVAVIYDKDRNIIDGHHRVEICQELGITDWPKDIRENLSEEEKYALAYNLNIARRHLNQEEKREKIAAQLRATPEKSNRSIAKDLKVDHKTVGATRKKLETTGEIPQLGKTTGADGKTRKVKVKPTRKEAAESRVDTTDAPDEAPQIPVDTHEAEKPPKKQRECHASSSEYYSWVNEVMEHPDLKPLSFAETGNTSGTGNSFKNKEDALAQDWEGGVWLNLLPFGNGKLGFVEKLINERKNDNCTECMALSGNDTQEPWFQILAQASDAVFFQKADSEIGKNLCAENPNNGPVIFYMGEHGRKFLKTFSEHGAVIGPK